MKTYKIVGRTNGWLAQRDINFAGNTTITISEGMTLRDAQLKLLEMFNHDYEQEIGSLYKNWGLVRCNHPYVTSSFKDGTRSFEYDSRYYDIEAEI